MTKDRLSPERIRQLIIFRAVASILNGKAEKMGNARRIPVPPLLYRSLRWTLS